MRDTSQQVIHGDPLIPNGETTEAIEAARRGEVVKVGDVDDLLADLHTDDCVARE